MSAAAATRLPRRTSPFPAHYQAHGRLYRAIVSLPEHMCAADRPLQERWVFFDCPSTEQPSARLETLLALAWNTDTAGWTEHGLIYNTGYAPDVIAEQDGDDDSALFVCASGGDGIEYVAACDVDYFCTPRVRARLEAALLRAWSGVATKGRAA